jgi:hypothetical protein
MLASLARTCPAAGCPVPDKLNQLIDWGQLIDPHSSATTTTRSRPAGSPDLGPALPVTITGPRTPQRITRSAVDNAAYETRHDQQLAAAPVAQVNYHVAMDC